MASASTAPIALGDFDLLPDGAQIVSEVHIAVRPVDLLTYWRRCGMVADFAARFFSYRHPDRFGETLSTEDQEIYTTVSTIINEFIQNAATYSRERRCIIHVNFTQFDDIQFLDRACSLLMLDVTNEVTEETWTKFKHKIEEVYAAEDPMELYLETLANKPPDATTSGIGILWLLTSFPTKLGFRFSLDDDGIHRVTCRAFVGT